MTLPNVSIRVEYPVSCVALEFAIGPICVARTNRACYGTLLDTFDLIEKG